MIPKYAKSSPRNPSAKPIVSNVSLEFERLALNLVWARSNIGGTYNMGGCMGCHGVSRVRGYSFSFVLLGGYLGAASDTQSAFDAPPPTLPDPEQ